VEFANGLLHLLLPGGGGQVTADACDTDLFAVTVLATHVGMTARIITDQDGTQPRGDALGPQLGHSTGQFLPDALGDGLAVENGRAHGDRKSTRLNSSHVSIPYAVFCLK